MQNMWENHSALKYHKFIIFVKFTYVIGSLAGVVFSLHLNARIFGLLKMNRKHFWNKFVNVNWLVSVVKA